MVWQQPFWQHYRDRVPIVVVVGAVAVLASLISPWILLVAGILITFLALRAVVRTMGRGAAGSAQVRPGSNPAPVHPSSIPVSLRRTEPLAYVGKLDCVGESFYVANIATVWNHIGRRDNVELEAWLSSEPTNPHDANAVQVLIPVKGRPVLVGYLPRELAARVAPVVRASEARGITPTAVAVVSAPFKGELGDAMHAVRLRGHSRRQPRGNDH